MTEEQRRELRRWVERARRMARRQGHNPGFETMAANGTAIGTCRRCGALVFVRPPGARGYREDLGVVTGQGVETSCEYFAWLSEWRAAGNPPMAAWAREHPTPEFSRVRA